MKKNNLIRPLIMTGLGLGLMSQNSDNKMVNAVTGLAGAGLVLQGMNEMTSNNKKKKSDFF